MEQADDRSATKYGAALQLRLIDLHTAVAVSTEATIQPSGARRRIAEQMKLEPSVVTDRIKRVEKNLGIELFDPQNPSQLTRAGQRMADQGRDFVISFAQLVDALRVSK